MKAKLGCVVILLLVVLVHTSGYAQEGTWELGPVGGLNLATTTEDVGSDTRSALSTFHAGAMARYWVLQQVAVQAFLLYNNKGGIQEASDGSWKWEERLGYLSIQIPALYRLRLSQAIALGLLAGPEFSFLMSAKYKQEYTFMGTTTTDEGDLKDELKAFELGLLFGAMLEYSFPNFKTFVQYQYALGLSRIHKDDQFDAKNRVHMFTLGFAFSLQ
jgi:hypothetical protein